MSRNDRLRRTLAALALLCFCLPLMASSIIDEAGMADPQAAYNTAQVIRGTISRQASGGAYLYYPVVAQVRCLVRQARLESLGVVRLNRFEEGDVLGSIRSEASRADLTQAALALARTREGLEEGERERREAIEEARQALEGLDAAEREAARLRLERQSLELELYLLNGRHTVASQERTVGELEERLNGAEVLAPLTGSVESYTYLNQGDSLQYGQVLLTMHRDDVFLLRIEDTEDRFRYGMEIEVQYGPRNERKTAYGRIVSSDNVRRSGDSTGFAYARLYDGFSPDEMTALTAYGETFRLDDVLLIPRKAARLVGGKQMVTILDGASLANRYVNISLTNSEYSWVLQGLEEGQTVVLD